MSNTVPIRRDTRRVRADGASSVLRSDGIVIARSHSASKDAHLSTGYGDESIQRTWAHYAPLDCFPPGPEARGSQ